MEFESESVPRKMVAENWERVLYARLSLPENGNPELPGLFDYLVIAWLLIHSRYLELQKLADDLVVGELSKRRAGQLSNFADLIMNYVGLVINPDMIDMFPQNHEYGAGYFGSRLVTVSDPESTYPRYFMECFITRFAEEGLIEVLPIPKFVDFWCND